MAGLGEHHTAQVRLIRFINAVLVCVESSTGDGNFVITFGREAHPGATRKKVPRAGLTGRKDLHLKPALVDPTQL